MKRIILVHFLLFLCGSTFVATAQTPSQLRVTSVRYPQKLPLLDALARIGLHVREGFVSFGVDISGESVPEVELDIPDTTLGDALVRVTSQIPGYTSEFVSPHVVEIYPAKERANQEDPLNLPIREFSAKDIPAFLILSQPARYIPELNDYLSSRTPKDHKESANGSAPACGRFVSNIGSFAQGVSLFVTGRTVRQILDAVAEADAVLPVVPDSPHATPPSFRMPPSGWVHRRTKDPKLGIVDTWSSATFAPHDWKLYAPK